MENPSAKERLSETSLIKTKDVSRDAHSPLVLQLGSSDQNVGGGVTVGLLWKSVSQRLLLTIPLGILLSAAACTALWYFSEDKYLSMARLLIRDKQPFLAYDIKDQSQSFSHTQVELLRDPHIISQAIENEDLAELPEIREIRNTEDPVLWIGTRLKVKKINKSELYEISFLTREAKSSQKVVSAIIKSYMVFQQNEANIQRSRMLQILAEEKKTREGEIEHKREILRALVKQAGGDIGINPGRQIASITPEAIGRAEVVSELKKQLIDTQVEIELKNTDLTFLQELAENSKGVFENDVLAAIARDPVIANLERQLDQLKKKLVAMNPKLKVYSDIKEATVDLENQIAARKQELREEETQKIQDERAEKRKSFVAQAEAEIENQKKRIGVLREKLHMEFGQGAEQGDKSLEIEFARDELTRAEAVARLLNDRMVQLTTEGRAFGPVQLIADPKVPIFPDGPSMAKKIAMVGIGGFFVPLALFAGWDLLYRRVYEREQLQREMKVKFVSEVAALPIRSLIPRRGSGKEFKHQSLLFEESVNALRTTLSVDKSLDGCRVFVMASAVSGEGKTNLSSQLAMSWSQAEPGKVILVDADLRSPNVHDLFEVPPGPGLAEVLRGECSLEEATVMDWGDRLYILPAGDLGADSASQLFSGPAFHEVMTKLRSQYTKIMIDVPPVLCASETLLIAKQADGVLMCALHDYSRAGQIKQAYDRLSVAGVTVVGAVLNGAPVREYSYAYRGYGAN